MTPAQDPFYIVKDEIQESIDKLQSAFHQWEQTPSNAPEHAQLAKELVASCESIGWQVEELSKTITVASRDPAYYGLNETELGRRKNWTASAQNQVRTIRRSVESEKGKGVYSNGLRRELLGSSQTGRSNNQYTGMDNDDFITSESDHQMLLIKQQDEELDELSASVQKIGGIGLTIHDELVGQERIVDDLSLEMETTSNRLDFVQKRVAMVMKKASAKGQIMMIAFLILLFIILFVLVFLT